MRTASPATGAVRLCAVLAGLSVPVAGAVDAAVVEPGLAVFDYGWQVDAEAFLTDDQTSFPGVFAESRDFAQVSSTLTANPATFQGSVESPQPGKLYDGLPFLIQAGPGTFVDEIAFEQSWSDARGGVGFDLDLQPGTGSFAATVMTDARANASTQPEPDEPALHFSLSTGRARALAEARLSLPFGVRREAGEADGFDLSVSFAARLEPDDQGFARPVTNQFFISLRNDTDFEQLFLLDFDNAAVPHNAAGLIAGQALLPGLDFGDAYFLEIYARSQADALSSAELILTPTDDPEVFIVEGVDYAFEFDLALGDLEVLLQPIAQPAAQAMPGPPALALFGLGVLALSAARRRRRF